MQGRWLRLPKSLLVSGRPALDHSVRHACTLPADRACEASQLRQKEGTMPGPKTGALAPDFALPADDGGTVSLSALRGQKVVLYFYPADNTETCTIEAIDFSGRQPDFAAAGAVIVGVSPDSTKSHERFKAKHRLGIRLAADEDLKVIRKYGLWAEKSMFGRKFMGVERATFLIAPDGRVAQSWRKVRIKGHVDEVLEAVRSL
jgi:peroxiredoxin Q/BCP